MLNLFPHQEVRQATAKPFWIVPAKSIPAQSRLTAAKQIFANARADAAKLIPANSAFHFQTQSNPNPAGEVRSKPFSACVRILFPTREVYPTAIPAFHLPLESSRRRR